LEEFVSAGNETEVCLGLRYGISDTCHKKSFATFPYKSISRMLILIFKAEDEASTEAAPIDEVYDAVVTESVPDEILVLEESTALPSAAAPVNETVVEEEIVAVSNATVTDAPEPEQEVTTKSVVEEEATTAEIIIVATASLVL
jgi:hypothetical protein